MFCPQCGGEYRPGFTDCADCGVPLVPQPPESGTTPAEPDLDLVTIFESANPALIGVVRSILDSADIEFVTKGEALQDLFRMGSVVFQVGSKNAEKAKALLRELEESEQSQDDLGDSHDAG
jgi:hypothetical protein